MLDAGTVEKKWVRKALRVQGVSLEQWVVFLDARRGGWTGQVRWCWVVHGVRVRQQVARCWV